MNAFTFIYLYLLVTGVTASVSGFTICSIALFMQFLKNSLGQDELYKTKIFRTELFKPWLKLLVNSPVSVMLYGISMMIGGISSALIMVLMLLTQHWR